MNDLKLSIKKLTSSDLSFFKIHLKKSKQKAINLNSDIFIDKFFPSLKNHENPILFSLSVIGPNGKSSHLLTRKVLRSPGSKNWRLNGEFIHDPDDDPERYYPLCPDDFAIMSFSGILQPDHLTLILISKTLDSSLYLEIEKRFPELTKKSMISIDMHDILEIKEKTITSYSEIHPFTYISTEDSIEEVLFGTENYSTYSEIKKTTPAPLTPMTNQELRRRLAAAEAIGSKGEDIFHRWLISESYSDDSYEWTSQDYARAPYDFYLKGPKWSIGLVGVYIDVKTTSGNFENSIHLSFSELKMASSSENYKIARIYDLSLGLPKLKILGNTKHIATDLLKWMEKIPYNSKVDSVEISPMCFTIEFETQIDKFD